MMRPNLSKALIIASVIAVTGYNCTAYAHSGGATMDKNGTNRSATAMADATCFNDGNGEPDHIIADIKDMSPPVPGLFVSLQIIKGNKATNTTDIVSGDAEYSPPAVLQGGAGVYRLVANKTNVGARKINVNWHCETADNIHTGTSIIVRQFQ